MIMKGKRLHDSYLNQLYEEYRDEYSLLVKNKKYINYNCYMEGEIDLLGLVDSGHVDLFEIKSRKTKKSRKKAKKQLNNAEEYYNSIHTVVDNKYIYYGFSDELVRVN